ncbi:MAG TPA: hypothetical protein VI796_02765 [Candidatus Thermoplasmatota archaeon]|nr:hypothetical protein [Candidatus Thermoplasmatota archaeon]
MTQYIFSVVWMRGPAPLVVVIVDPSYGHLGSAAQTKVRSEITTAAARSGLVGEVALAWDLGNGKVAYLGPEGHRNLVTSGGLRRLQAAVNKKLVCNF